MSSSDTEPYLLVEKCGSSRGKPIYVITNASNTYPIGRTREIRCMDVGAEALGSYKTRQGGCTQIQFFNESLSGVLKCTNAECGMEFSKTNLRDSAYIEVRGLPS
ncbi:hypothetical protein V8B97DRAFT_1695400 [Scleroderma yunnanense]